MLAEGVPGHNETHQMRTVCIILMYCTWCAVRSDHAHDSHCTVHNDYAHDWHCTCLDTVYTQTHLLHVLKDGALPSFIPEPSLSILKGLTVLPDRYIDLRFIALLSHTAALLPGRKEAKRWRHFDKEWLVRCLVGIKECRGALCITVTS